MKNKKYELTNNKRSIGGVTVYQIRSLVQIPALAVKPGDLGGWIQREENLSHNKAGWLSDNSVVYEDARVYDNAWIRHNARISGGAMVYNSAQVRDNAWVFGKAHVYEWSVVKNDSWVSGNAKIYYKNVVNYGHCRCDLNKDMLESVRVQTGLGVFENKVIAYKIVNRDLTSIYDPDFRYVVGTVAEVKYPDTNNVSCARGLHFSNINYWDKYKKDTTFLLAEINLEDIITVQDGKIRVKRAKILSSYTPKY